MEHHLQRQTHLRFETVHTSSSFELPIMRSSTYTAIIFCLKVRFWGKIRRKIFANKTCFINTISCNLLFKYADDTSIWCKYNSCSHDKPNSIRIVAYLTTGENVSLKFTANCWLQSFATKRLLKRWILPSAINDLFSCWQIDKRLSMILD